MIEHQNFFERLNRIEKQYVFSEGFDDFIGQNKRRNSKFSASLSKEFQTTIGNLTVAKAQEVCKFSRFEISFGGLLLDNMRLVSALRGTVKIDSSQKRIQLTDVLQKLKFMNNRAFHGLMTGTFNLSSVSE